VSGDGAKRTYAALKRPPGPARARISLPMSPKASPLALGMTGLVPRPKPSVAPRANGTPPPPGKTSPGLWS